MMNRGVMYIDLESEPQLLLEIYVKDQMEPNCGVETPPFDVAKTSEITDTDCIIIFSEIKVRLAETPDPATDKLAQQTPSPYLLPALAVSVLLNLVTGGAIITNFIAPEERDDSEPYQAAHLDLSLNVYSCCIQNFFPTLY